VEGVYYLRDSAVQKLRAFLPAFVIPEHLTHYFSTLRVKIDGYTYKSWAALDRARDWFVDRCTCSHLGLCKDCEEAREVEFCYPLLITNGFLYQPRNGNATLLMAWVRRGYSDPTKGQLATPDDEQRFYASIGEQCVEAAEWMKRQPLQPESYLTLEECGKAMGGARGRNFLESIETYMDGSSRWKKHIQEKWNEQLTYKEGGLKPRLITAFSTDWQNATQQLARELSRQAKAWFNGTRVLTVGGRPVRFCIADPKPETLDSYGDLLTGSTPFVLVSGDDTIMGPGNDADPPFSLRFGESDYSMYDQSQFLILWQHAVTWLEGWGFGARAIELIYKAVKDDVTGGKKHPLSAKMHGRMHPHMPSGKSITTIIGSLFNLTNWANGIQKKISIEESSRQLGLTVKTAYSKTLEGMTFLRGWWVHSRQGNWTWANLPSLVLKLGKTFKNPVTIVRENAHAAVLKAICMSVQVAEDYPILGALNSVAQRLAGQTDCSAVLNDPYIVENAQHKVFGGRYASRGHVMELMCDRYGVTPAEVEGAEALLESVTEVPCFVSHVVFERMRMVDYAP
jgi:hypothetical protein